MNLSKIVYAISNRLWDQRMSEHQQHLVPQEEVDQIVIDVIPMGTLVPNGVRDAVADLRRFEEAAWKIVLQRFHEREDRE